LVEGGWEWLNCFNHPKKQNLSLEDVRPTKLVGIAKRKGISLQIVIS